MTTTHPRAVQYFSLCAIACSLTVQVTRIAVAAPPDCEFEVRAATGVNEQFSVQPITDYVGDMPLSIDVGVAANGHFMVVWGQEDVSGRVFASGVPGAGPSVTISPRGAAEGDNLAVSATSSDGFAVAWSQNTALDGLDVFTRVYDPVGTALSDIIQVNSYVTGHQTSPIVATDSSGGFLVAWTRQGLGAARRFGADGSALGDEFTVSLVPHAARYYADGAIDIMGIGTVPGVIGLPVAVERFAAQAETPTEKFALVSTPSLPVMDVLTDGFVSVWSVFRRNDRVPSGFRKMVARRFNFDGSPRGRQLGLSKHFKTVPVEAEVAALSDGGFATTWQRGTLPSGNTALNPERRAKRAGVWARVVAADGKKTTPREIRVERLPHGYQPALGAGTDSQFVIAWHSLSVRSFQYNTEYVSHYYSYYSHSVRAKRCSTNSSASQ